MGWFRRLREGIQTATNNKRETPDGVWYNCKRCKQTSRNKELQENFYKCPKCDYHVRIGSQEYFSIIFDNGASQALFSELVSKDIINFVDVKAYPKRLEEAQATTKLGDAMASAVGLVDGLPLVICCMDFKFIGGSMGSVVGEKIARSIDYCLEHRLPFMIISKSGGARMMESAFSLMQMAKTSARLAQLDKAGIPYVSLLTDPTTGGVTASYAMLGDFNIAEPGSLIGFAGPRIIRETIGKDLPKDFQTAEFVLEHGFLDFIISRKDLKDALTSLLEMLK